MHDRCLRHTYRHGEYVEQSEGTVLDVTEQIDEIQTSLLRALASPHRLRLLHLLGRGPREVNELVRETSLAQAAVSQHLAALRSVGLVEATRDGRFVRYRLTDPEILAACDLMRGVIVRRLSALGTLAAAARRVEPAVGPATSTATEPQQVIEA
jgi:ArsR family transcriptional regulator